MKELKREELNYFDDFVKNSNYALECAKLLEESVKNYNIDRAEEFEYRVHQIENKADENQHKILNYLVKDFLPPIDREDIIRISHKIDDVIDNIDEIVTNFNILNVKIVRDDVNVFVELLLNSLNNMIIMLEKFKNIKKYNEIKEYVIVLNKLEEQGDRLYQSSIKKLYSSIDNPIEIIIWTTIYNCFENCFDSCENVADCVEEIIMKNN